MQHIQFIQRYGLYLSVALLIGLTSGCYSSGIVQQQQAFRPPVLNGNLSGYAQAPAGGYAQQPAVGYSGYPQYAGYQQNNSGYQQSNPGFQQAGYQQQQNFAAGYNNQLQAQQASWNNQRGFNPFGFGSFKKTTC